MYIIKITSIDEIFYKIGITNQDISRRFREHDTFYNIELITLIKSNRYDAIVLENKLHNLHKDCIYKPKQAFSGHTECFLTFKGIPNE